MSQYLPTGEYRWLSDDEVAAFHLDAWAENGAKGCLLEVDLEFPDKLHDLLVDYPPAPEKKPISYAMLSEKQRELLGAYTENVESWQSVPKLVPSLESKHKYVVHYRALQLYVKLGVKLTTIHRALEFAQAPWLKPYIDFNTDQRAAA